MAKTCGSCNLQGGSLPKNKILCLYDNAEHDARDTCNHCQPYIPGISIEVRNQMASNLRNSEDTERRHKENLKIAELERKIQFRNWVIGIIILFIPLLPLLLKWSKSLWKFLFH